MIYGQSQRMRHIPNPVVSKIAMDGDPQKGYREEFKVILCFICLFSEYVLNVRTRQESF